MALKASFLAAKRKHRLEMKAVNELMLPENYPLSFWEETIANHRSQVAVVGGQVVAYCLCSDRGHIMSLAVLKEHQGKGYAGRLLADVMAKEVQQSYSLHVRINNEIALKLYRRAGFRIVEQLSGYYEDGTDALSMVRCR